MRVKNDRARTVAAAVQNLWQRASGLNENNLRHSIERSVTLLFYSEALEK